MVRLFALRHAPVDAAGICYGQVDVPTLLTPDEVARYAVAVLEDFVPGTVWSSDAARCRLPGLEVSSRFGIDCHVDHRVREMSYGQWEGKPWDDLDREAVDYWMEDWMQRSPPGGETLRDMEARIGQWWEDLAPGDHLLLAHAGVIHVLNVLSGAQTWDETMSNRLDYLAVARFERP